jgi:two-component system cell cycle sensor histidine kinase/response regulator CckA
LKTTITRSILLISIGLGLLTWLADAFLDALLFRKGNVLDALLAPTPRDILIRSFMVLVLFAFGLYAGKLIERLRRTEARFHESEIRFRSVVETARDVIYTLSPEGRFTSLNPAFERITGWPCAETLGSNFLSLVHSDDAVRATDIFQNAMRGSIPDVVELRILARSGDILTGEFTITPQVHNGGIAGVLGIARDVTQRKKEEQALHESEARYRDLFENANDLIQSVAADGTFQYVNRAWREALGYSADEASRLVLSDVVHPDFRQHCMEIFSRVAAGEKLNHVECLYLTKSGKPLIVEGNINASIVDGVAVATRGIFRDITAHRYATEFVKNVLESVDEGFTVINPEYRIISANKAYADKLKLPIQDIIGKHCYEVSHRITRPCFEAGEDCAVRKAFATGARHTAIHVHYDNDGNLLFIETKAFPLKDSLGRIVSAIEIHNDVTDKKRLEDQLRHAQKMEAIGTLAGGIAHDFNNILTAIIGYGTLLQLKIPENNVLRSHVDQILMSTERASSLTQSLLAFSRKQPMHFKTVDLVALVDRTQKLIARLIGEDIDIKIVAHRTPVMIKADTGQIEQVLMNLAANARDAMPKGGLLTIETSIVELDGEFIRTYGYGKTGTYGLLQVRDTGAGMEEKTLKRIFEPFYTTKEVGKGTGLGLSIVYGIVKQHNGYINASSEPGKGTGFMLYVPLISDPLEETLPVESEDLEGGLATILVAEDDDNVRNLTRAVLEGFGYTVIDAVDGEDALKKFREHEKDIQLLFMDILMPKKNGTEVYAAIKQDHPDVKALFTSGYSADLMRAKGIVVEEGFIAKPVSPRDLLKHVRKTLGAGYRPARHLEP